MILGELLIPQASPDLQKKALHAGLLLLVEGFLVLLDDLRLLFSLLRDGLVFLLQGLQLLVQFPLLAEVEEESLLLFELRRGFIVLQAGEFLVERCEFRPSAVTTLKKESR